MKILEVSSRDIPRAPGPCRLQRRMRAVGLADHRSNDTCVSLRILQYAFYLSTASKLHVE